MMAAKKQVTGKRMRAVRVGAGVAAGIAGAVAGAYLLYERTKPQQKQAKAWIMKSRKAAGIEAKRLSKIGEKEYHRMMEKALRHYGAMEKVSAPEIASAIREAKAEWKHIQTTAKKAAKPAGKKAAPKRTVKRSVTKKTARRK